MKEKLSKDLADILREFVSKKTKEAYAKFYTGKIVDNVDPEKLGRCKIRVFSVYGEEIPDADLPWAVPDFNFIGSTIGSFVVPPIDAIIKVYFDNGDIYVPRYTTKVVDGNNISNEAGEDYPDTMVFFETDEGEYFKINRKTNETTYRTASGVMIKVDADGIVSIDSQDTETGDVSITTKGKIILTTGDDTTIDVTGNVIIEATGDADVKGTNVTVEGSSQVLLKTGDALAWKPCILPACLFTGAPHGGPTAGISKLKGS